MSTDEPRPSQAWCERMRGLHHIPSCGSTCLLGLTLNRNWGTHQANCFYDSTTRLLVGANVANDSASYCDHTSASMSTGDVPVPYPHYCILSSPTTERSMSCGDPSP